MQIPLLSGGGCGEGQVVETSWRSGMWTLILAITLIIIQQFWGNYSDKLF